MNSISGFKNVTQNAAQVGDGGVRESAAAKKAESLYSDKFRDYSHLPSAKELPVSDEEFKDKVADQAKADVKRGVYQGSEFRSMQGKYVQVVSPDRENVVYNMVNAMVRSQPPVGEPNVDTDVYRSGHVVATYSPQDGWYPVQTPEESARAAEIGDVYNRAWARAYSEAPVNNMANSSPYKSDFLIGVSIFSATV